MEDFSAKLLSGRLVFGKYPTPEEANLLVAEKFTYVVNLCPKKEITWEPYTLASEINIISYPFEDGKLQKPELPNDWSSFSSFIEQLLTILFNKNNKMYIHCLGGHGRSPTIAAILYGKLRNKNAEDAIAVVRTAHQKRKMMLDKWRKLGAPQRAKQKSIIKRFLSE